MGGIFEEIGHAAMAKTYSGGDGSRDYTSRSLAEEVAQGHNNQFNYMMPTQKDYQGRMDPVDTVKNQAERKPSADIYQNPVKSLNSDRSIYAALLNYKFMN
jgi:hypothetical protein